MSARAWLAEGTAQRWLTGAAVVLALAMIVGLVLVVVVVAGRFFWPAPLLEVTLADDTRHLGERWGAEEDPSAPGRDRWRLKVGNRELGSDFVWLRQAEMRGMRRPGNAWLVERLEYGIAYGFPLRIEGAGASIAATEEEFGRELGRRLEAAAALRREEGRLLGTLADAHAPVERASARLRAASRRQRPTAALEQRLAAAQAAEEAQAEQALARLDEVRSRLAEDALVLETAAGEELRLPLAGVVRIVRPNQMSTGAKLGVYASRWWEFLSAEPRESNTEGGIFPALFGTALMVMLMTVVVVPLGVVTAVYLSEYARENLFTNALRLALANLAGVPSIVFGAFGLAFFVYTVGGSLDRLLFADNLPAPTFGTGGILWASLTLALLTVPVVVIATEEGLRAVPQAVRDGARALGATRAQTLRRVVLPYAAPGMLTGAILAVARAAGEVAPLMLTGVVKLAPAMPFDSTPPFLHLERKFMHLGFHVFDVGFQSPNIEAAMPTVYATVLVLLVLVVALNLVAIMLRARLRRRLRSAAV